MTLTTPERRQLTDDLVSAWDDEDHPTEMTQPRARLGKRITTSDVASMETVVGPAVNVHETAPALRLLIDSGDANATVPLVRLMDEYSWTATWFGQSEDRDRVKVSVRECTRQQTSLQEVLRRLIVKISEIQLSSA